MTDHADSTEGPHEDDRNTGPDARPDDTPHPDQVDPDDGTDQDDAPIDNPAG